MKRFLLGVSLVIFGSVSAYSADLPARPYTKSPPLVSPSYNWSGFYVGVNAAYDWQDSTAVTFRGNDPQIDTIFNSSGFGGGPVTPIDFRMKGGSGGGQLGYNFQVNPSWVLGVETDFNGSSIKGDGTTRVPQLGADFTTIRSLREIDWYGTLRARLGWLVTDSLMLYGTGGLAYAHIKESTSLNRPDGQIAFGGFPFSFACNPTTIPCFNGSSARTEFGWTAGGGAEYAINRTFSLKFEYLYIGLREDRINVVAQRASVQSRDTPSSFTAIYGRADFQTVRVGLNAHF